MTKWRRTSSLSTHTHSLTHILVHTHTYRCRWACACPDADTDIGIETRIARSSSKEIFVFAIRINKNFTRQLPQPPHLLTSLPAPCFRGNFINWKSHLRVNFLKEIFALFSRNRISISYENCQTTDEGGKRGLPVADDDEFHKYMNKTWGRLSGRLSGHLFAADSLKTKPGQSRAEQS